jgi:hypothetical protein
MSSIYEKAAAELFETIDPETTSISMSFVELSGDTCSDLLNAFSPAQLLTGQDGGVYAFPIVEPEISTEEELIAFINHGCKVRTTAATGVNDTSSRSHAILRIYVLNKITNTEGVLTLVDLAGSEHRIDSMYHSAERRKEGAGINASLMALKEVLRAKASKKDASFYYRKSKLTMALKSSFSDPYARTVVIVTASPASKDTEHSLNSLRHACIMSGQDHTAGGETRFMTGGRTTVEKIGEVDVCGIARENKKNIKSGKGLDGLKTSNGNTASFGSNIASQELTKDEENKKRLRARRASERKAIALLTKEQKHSLQVARDQLGVNRRQQQRLRRVLQAPPPVLHQGGGECESGDGENSCEIELTAEEQLHAYGQGQQQQPPAKPKPKPKPTGPVRKKVEKIRAMIFSDEYTPEEIKYKQFRAQLKKNGYTQDEVDSILAKEGCSVNAPSSQPQKATRGHPSSLLAHSPVQSGAPPPPAQSSYQATGHGRPLAHSPPPPIRQSPVEKQHSRPPLVQNSPRQLVQNSPPRQLVQNSPPRQLVQNSPPRREAVQNSPLSQYHNPEPSRFDAGAFSSPPPPEMSRAEAAKERRLQQEAAQQEARRNKIAQKSKNSAVKATATGDNRTIAQLEQQLNQPDITAATKHAIKKKIAAHRAVLVREERKRNQDQRVAQEAARKQQQTAKRELSFSDTSETMPPPVQHESPGQPKLSMKNTADIESVLSPRFKSNDNRSFSPLQNRRQEASSRPSPPQPPLQQQYHQQPPLQQQQQQYQQPMQQQQQQQHQQYQQPMQQQQHYQQPMQQQQQYQQPMHQQQPQHQQRRQHQQHNQHPVYQDDQNAYTQYKQMQPSSHQQPPYQPYQGGYNGNQAAQPGQLRQQPLQSEALIGDSLDSLRLNAQNVVQSPPDSGAQRHFYRGHAGAGGGDDAAAGNNNLYRTRSSGGGKSVVSAAYSSPFATEMNYMSAKDSPY